MMQLGVIDFVAFSGVCKSWRSLSLFNRNKFMASRPPMSISISTYANEIDCYCYLEDSDGRKFKTLLPHSSGRRCVGVTCGGYLILFGSETKDFLLVNPITRHQLHFPDVPVDDNQFCRISGILVFSRSVSGWLFVMLDHRLHKIWFGIASKGEWNYVYSTVPILDILAFKGKIYTLNVDYHNRSDVVQLCEFIFDSESKLTLLKTKNFPKTDIRLLRFASCGENLYVCQKDSVDLNEIYEIEFGEMKWVSRGKRKIYELGLMNFSAYVGQCLKYPGGMFSTTYMQYFPNKCLNVDFID